MNPSLFSEELKAASPELLSNESMMLWSMSLMDWTGPASSLACICGTSLQLENELLSKYIFIKDELI